jgi:hypothetical protein
MNANHKITMSVLAGIVLGAVAVVASANSALAQDMVRVRGTIESIDGSTYAIKSRDGADLKVALPDSAQIAAVVRGSLVDIKQGSFVGVTAMPQADGSLSALEVHIFPEAMRGSGEGHYSWDLRPGSTMTNATVDQVITDVDGQTLTLKYKNGENENLCPSRYADCRLREGGQFRSQAWRESLHRCDQAGRRNAAGSRVARRSGWNNTAYLIVVRGILHEPWASQTSQDHIQRRTSRV